MTKYILLFLALCLPLHAATVFVSQSGGSVSCGADGTQTTTAQASVTWTAGNTYKLCGTLTSALTVGASGSAGNVITIFFESGSKISMAVCPSSGCLNLNAKNFITIDGGVACGPSVLEASCQGTIEATANGTSLANQTSATVGINADSSSNITIKNLLIRNIYVHVTGTGSTGTGWEIDSATAQAIWSQNGSSNVLIQDTKIHDANWSVQFVGTTGNFSTIEFNRVDWYRVDHCIAVGISGTNTADTILTHDSRCHDTANWDDTTLVGLNTNNHHDGIHLFVNAGSSAITNVYTWNTKFDGDWGQYTTAEIFEECGGTGHVDHTFYNNLFTSSNTSFTLTNGTVNDGNIACSGTSHTKAYNNTFICSISQATYCNQLTVATDYRNNIQVNQNSGFGILTSTTSGTSGTFDYNIYGTPYGTPFFINAVESTYTTWKTKFGGSESHSPAGNVYASLAAIGINSSGTPQTGFVGASTGLNLTSLCVGNVTKLCLDPNGAARPASAAWDAGAYQFVNSGTYTITVSAVTGNGTVTSSDGVLNCTTGATGTCSDASATGTITLTATATAGNTFTAWGGGTCSGSALTCNVTNTATVTATFIANAAATPTFSPVAGTYTVAQSVTISTASGGAIICYTTNGQTPATNGADGCNTGTLYSSAVSVPSTLTLKAVAGGTGFGDSALATAAYAIVQPPAGAVGMFADLRLP